LRVATSLLSPLGADSSNFGCCRTRISPLTSNFARRQAKLMAWRSHRVRSNARS
jgi:hypothetical protein